MTQITISFRNLSIIDGEIIITVDPVEPCGTAIDEYTKEYFGTLLKTLHDYGLHDSTIEAIMEIAVNYTTNRPHLALRAHKLLSREKGLSEKEVADLMHFLF